MLFSKMDSILIYCKQDRQVALYAQKYLMVAFPKLVLFGLMDCHRRWLNSFQKNHIPMLCSWISIPFHYVWCYIFVVIFDLELYGIGIAGALSFSI